LLIVAAQMKNFFGLPVPQAPSFVGAISVFLAHFREINVWSAAVGAVTLAAAIVSKRASRRVPYLLTGMVVGSVFAYVLARLDMAHVPTIGALPSAIPGLSLPDFSAGTWRNLAPVAFALTVIGLTEAISSARAVAARSGQRIDGNQEFIGQGLANIVGAFTSCYPTSGSFNRTGANYEAGARTPMAAIFSAGFLLIILLLVSPLATYLPLAVMAALLFIVAYGLIDVQRFRETIRASRSETLVLIVTFLATLFVQLEFAILVGVLCSLFVYLNRTTHPAVRVVAPHAASVTRRFEPVAGSGAIECPQLALVRLDGSLFFGAVDHVIEELAQLRAAHPPRKNLLLIGSGINFIDVAGCELLVRESMEQRSRGGTLYLCNLKPNVLESLELGGFLDRLGRVNVFASKDAAIRGIYARLDADICRACTARIFVECNQRLPDGSPRNDPEVGVTAAHHAA